MSRCRVFASVLAVCGLMLGCRQRVDFPDRPILLICPWSAGGGTDRVSRQVAVLLEAELGVPVNVVNATGGSGVTGHTRGAQATPDGYTITMITVELNMLHWRGLTNISPRDFEPLMLLNRDDAALFVRDDAPWKTLDDLVRAIRANPRGLKASGTAQGGIWHVSLAGWLDSLGLRADDVLWISINGAAPSLQELMSGGVDLVCCSLPEAQTLLEADRIRCLGVMAPGRVRAFPDVPTFREQGFDWAMGGWRGLALPVGVPRDRFETLHSAVRAVILGDDYLQAMRAAGFDTTSAEPEEFRAVLERLDAQFGAILTGESFRTVRRTRFGPMTFPAILAVLLAITFTALSLTGGFKTWEGLQAATPAGLRRVGLALGAVILYLLLAETLGYVLTASLSLLLLLRGLQVRWPVAIGVTALLVPLSYQVFAVAMRVPLPWGLLGW